MAKVEIRSAFVEDVKGSPVFVLCVSCHGVAESRDAGSEARGMWVRALGVLTPFDVPVQHSVHGWCWLLGDGSVALQADSFPF